MNQPISKRIQGTPQPQVSTQIGEIKKSGKETKLTKTESNTINAALQTFTGNIETPQNSTVATPDLATTLLNDTIEGSVAMGVNMYSSAMEGLSYLFSESAINDAGTALAEGADYLTSAQLGKDVQAATDYATNGDALHDLASGVHDILNYFLSGQLTSDTAKNIGGSLMTGNTLSNGSFAPIMARGLGMETPAGINFCETFCKNLAPEGEVSVNDKYKAGIDMMTAAASLVTDIKYTSISTTDLFERVDDVFKNDDNPITQAASHPDTVNKLAKTVLGNADSVQTTGEKIRRKTILKVGKSIVALANSVTPNHFKQSINKQAKSAVKSMAIEYKLYDQKNLTNLENKLSASTSNSSLKNNILNAITEKKGTDNLAKEENLPPEEKQERENNRFANDAKLSALLLNSFENQNNNDPVKNIIKEIIKNDFKDTSQ